MKATGIVRRIDDLGRIVIPKEIRRSFRIKEGDPLEIFTNADGEVIFKKYSPIGELSQFAGQYAEVLHKNGRSPVVITDNDHVVAAAGVSKREVMERRVTKALEDVMDARTPRIAKAPGECLQAIEGYDRPAEVAYPIVYGGDVSGTVLLAARGGRQPAGRSTNPADPGRRRLFGAANGVNRIVQFAQKVNAFLVHSSQYAEMAKKALHF